MADELRLMTGSRPDLEVHDLNSLMLSVCGLAANPADADNEWFQTTLPELAIEKLAEKPYLGGFEAICVDEFQDIAGNPRLLKVVIALAEARALVPDIVHLRLRTNCRTAPGLSMALQRGGVLEGTLRDVHANSVRFCLNHACSTTWHPGVGQVDVSQACHSVVVTVVCDTNFPQTHCVP